MNFYVARDGTILHVDPEPVRQFSVGVSKIYFIYPTVGNNLTVVCAFRLPNGETTPPNLMTYDKALSGIQDENKNTYSTWQVSLKENITQYYGTVCVQFFVYDGENILTTAESSFEVTRGVEYDIPEQTDSYDTLLNDILVGLSTIQQNFSNKVDYIQESGRLYVTGEQGKSLPYDYFIASDKKSVEPSPNTIAARDGNGAVKTIEPIEEDDAATKKFVLDSIDGVNGAIPSGGTAGQVLAKASDEDFDTYWVDDHGISRETACEIAQEQTKHLTSVKVSGVAVAEFDADTKLNKQIDNSSGEPLLYGLTEKLNWGPLAPIQQMYPLSVNASAGSVAFRTSSGALAVGTPQNSNEATPKQYVDNLTELYEHNIIIYPDYSASVSNGRTLTAIGKITLRIVNKSAAPYTSISQYSGRHALVSGIYNKYGNSKIPVEGIIYYAGEGQVIRMLVNTLYVANVQSSDTNISAIYANQLHLLGQIYLTRFPSDNMYSAIVSGDGTSQYLKLKYTDDDFKLIDDKFFDQNLTIDNVQNSGSIILCDLPSAAVYNARIVDNVTLLRKGVY